MGSIITQNNYFFSRGSTSPSTFLYLLSPTVQYILIVASILSVYSILSSNSRSLTRFSIFRFFVSSSAPFES
jgi:hypothetical protein